MTINSLRLYLRSHELFTRQVNINDFKGWKIITKKDL